VRCLALLLVAAVPSSARAGSDDEPTVLLRFATIAPEGTSWAREFRAFAREAEQDTGGQVRIRWYLGGIAGDDVSSGERLRRGQLDGVASGGILCERVAPSMRVLHIPGLLRSRDEYMYVLDRLRPIIDRETEKSGYVNLGSSSLGGQILFTRQPVRNMADLRRLKLAFWDLDVTQRIFFDAVGIPAVPLSPSEIGAAYDAGRIDGILAPASTALAFQWSARTRYLTPLVVDFQSGCALAAHRSLDALPIEQQRLVRTVAAKYVHRNDELLRDQDELLLSSLFQRQGLTRVPVSEDFRTEYFTTARLARDKLEERVVPRALLDRVLTLLADYRAEHGLH
jgi:TRAP-type transport system periplasmic protein